MNTRDPDAERGAAAIEFALISTFLLIPLMFGILQYGWYFAVDAAASSAGGQLARRISVGDCWAQADAEALVATRVSAATTVVTSPDPTTLSVGDVFTVTLTADGAVASLLPMPDDGVVTVTITSRLEDDRPGDDGC